MRCRHLVASSAHAFGPNGAALHSTLTSLGKALGALSSKSPQLTALFDNLGNLSYVASQYTGTYQAFANDLAVVSTELASDNADIGSALSNLQQALGSSGGVHQDQRIALSEAASRVWRHSPARWLPSNSSWLRSSAIFRRSRQHDPSVRSDRSRRSRPAVEARPDERLGELLQVGLRERSAPAAAACRWTGLRTRTLTVDLGCGVNGLLAALPDPTRGVDRTEPVSRRASGGPAMTTPTRGSGFRPALALASRRGAWRLCAQPAVASRRSAASEANHLRGPRGVRQRAQPSRRRPGPHRRRGDRAGEQHHRRAISRRT